MFGQYSDDLGKESPESIDLPIRKKEKKRIVGTLKKR